MPSRTPIGRNRMNKSLSMLVGALAMVAVALGAMSLRAEDKAAAGEAGNQPRKPVKILFTSQTQGFVHDSIPLGKDIVSQLAKESGGFEVTIDDELKHCTAEGLKAFDIVMFVNTTKDLAIDEAQKQALLDFIKSGKGFVGVHSATDTFYEWPAFGEMIGGYFDGHPWNSKDTVTIKVEKPEHAIVKPFGDAPFELTEEIYQMREPYDRSKCEVLLSLDTSKTDMTKKGVKRTDGDFAVAWIKPYGEGRVFYTSLGHNQAVWRDERFQKHLVAGIEWASGVGEDAKVGE